ncbi:MAG: hypothetical protein AAEJ53_16015 [Myxococcota bacterium]
MIGARLLTRGLKRSIAGLGLLPALPLAAGETPRPAPPALRTADSQLEEISAETRAELFEQGVLMRKGEPAREEQGRNAIEAFVIFDASPQQVYDLLHQTSRQGEFRPEVSEIREIERIEGKHVDEHRLKILFRRYVYRLDYRFYPEAWRIEWRLDDRFDNDLRGVTGYWELYRLEDGRTLGRSGTSVQVGASVPKFLANWITRINLPKSMKNLRAWINESARPHTNGLP